MSNICVTYENKHFFSFQVKYEKQYNIDIFRSKSGNVETIKNSSIEGKLNVHKSQNKQFKKVKKNKQQDDQGNYTVTYIYLIITPLLIVVKLFSSRG